MTNDDYFYVDLPQIPLPEFTNSEFVTIELPRAELPYFEMLQTDDLLLKIEESDFNSIAFVS